MQRSSESDRQIVLTRKGDVSPPRFTRWYRFVLWFGWHTVLPIMMRNRDIRTEQFTEKLSEPHMILFNHVSDYDHYGVINGYPHYCRFVASDALIRKLHMKVLMYSVSNFIFRRKGENADKVVDSIRLSIEKGISVCMAPEGGEAVNGVTTAIRSRTGQMIKDLGVGLVMYRLEGSYFVKPSWALKKAKGPTFGRVVAVHSKEEIARLSAEEINKLIADDLYLNHYDWQREKMIPYKRDAPAEAMEKVLFICPKCKQRETLHSHGDTFSCDCGYTVRVNDYGFLEGYDVIFDNLYDWDMWQRHYMIDNFQDWIADDGVIFRDEHQILKELRGDFPVPIFNDVILEMDSKELRVYGNGADFKFPLEDIISIPVVSRDNVGIIIDGKYYQVYSSVPKSGLKYRLAFLLLRGRDIF